jgi:hypothetical protein
MKFLHIALLLLITPGFIAAQNTGTVRNLGNEDITIVKEYQPVLKDAFKINIVPSGDTATAAPLALEYGIDPKPLNSNYTISPIKPVRIKDDNIRKLYRGFVKGGYGMESSALLDVYFNALRSKEFDAGVSYHHLSMNGKINDYGFPGNSENKLEAHGTRYFDDFSLKGAINYDRNMVHYYGYNSPPDLYSKEETRHLMDGFSGDFGIESAAGAKLGYYGGLNFYTFQDNRDTKENNFGLKGGIAMDMNMGILKVDASADFMNVEQDVLDYNRNLIRLNPRLEIKKDSYKISLGANVAIEGNDGDTDYHLYPLIRGEYHVINDLFNVWGELSGNLERTDIRGLAQRNPFFDGYMPLANANHKIKFHGGANVRLSRDLMLTASGGYSRITNMPFFFNDSSTTFPVTFTTVYDDIDLLNIRGALEYKRSEKFTAAVFTEYNGYGTSELNEALYVPALRFGFNGTYTMGEKIFAKLDLFYNSKLFGIEYTAAGEASTTELNGYFDANLGVDYRYNKNISVFAQLNNLGFAQYFRWYNYPSYRFTAMVGATIAF